MRAGSFYAGRLEITYPSLEEARAEAPAWVAYRCAAMRLRVTGEIAYGEPSKHGNVEVSVPAEYSAVGALYAAVAEHGGHAIPADELARCEARDAAYNAARSEVL